MSREEFLRSVGGKLEVRGGAEHWNFGLVLPEDRTAEELGATALAAAHIQEWWPFPWPFPWPWPRPDPEPGPGPAPPPEPPPDAKRVALWSAGKKLLGKFLPYNWQTTGSCVGAGGDNALKTLMAVEIVLGREKERFVKTWWPYTYGQSRVRSGMRRRGEGSTGEGWAAAIAQDGSLEVDEGGVDTPEFQEKDGWLQLPGSVEVEWSAGPPRDAESFHQVARRHRALKVARVRDAAGAAAAIRNGNPLTLASMLGLRRMVPAPQGNPPVRLARWDGSWAHQMFCDEVWEHPSLGLIFRIGNNWGPGAHGAPTGDEPPGGFYVAAETMGAVCSRGEVFAIGGYEGFQDRRQEVASAFGGAAIEAAA